MEKPNIVILRETGKEGYFLINLYGIDFEVKEGSTIGFKPLLEIADGLGITIDKLKSELKLKALLDDKHEVSKDKCWVEGVDGKHIEKDTYAFFALVHMYAFPEDCPDDLSKVKIDDHIDKGIYGHVQFITELLNPLTASVKKLHPKDGDIIVINGQILKRDKQSIYDLLHERECKALIMFVDNAGVNLADEHKMKSMGWVRNK